MLPIGCPYVVVRNTDRRPSPLLVIIFAGLVALIGSKPCRRNVHHDVDQVMRYDAHTNRIIPFRMDGSPLGWWQV
ncbi:hypothetical protein BDR03DRAFT_188506 [Suillus americanus]|nr:hypothetical protein BDR03DRAFT_188506 [Suillus americanus]